MEQIRDRAIVYLEANHTDTAQLMQSLFWGGGRQKTGLIGSEIYLYNSGNWPLQIQYPFIPNPIYTITANYTSQDATINCMGLYNGTFTETSQSTSVTQDTLSVQEQVQDITLTYLKAYHNET
jgi:hypothetical protein